MAADSAVEPSHRQQALAAIIELRRLDQLKAIASSTSNSTYFFGDKAALGSGSNEAYSVDYAENIKKGVEKKTPVGLNGDVSVL